MRPTRQIFVPQIKADEAIIREVKLDEVLALTKDQSMVDGGPNMKQYCGHTMNFGDVRYHMFNETRRCKCCQIVMTHAFLEYDPDNTDPNGKPVVTFNFYAETKDKEESDASHLVKMTNHRECGVVCATCGFILGQTRASIFDVQKSLFNAYRAYRSSFALRETDEVLKPAYSALQRHRNLIENVTQGMTKASDDARGAMRDKILIAEAQIETTLSRMEVLRTKAQQTGVIATEAEAKAAFFFN